ncbi:MAG: acyl carrier protein [Sandaracinaceae bacterium]
MTTTDDRHAEVLDRLLALAAERFGRDRGDLEPAEDLFDALGIDSMEALGLLSALEDTFEVELPDYEVQDVRTFADLARAVAARL